MIYCLLFWEFAKVGLFCVGGGYASMPLIEASVVDTYHWLTLSEFVDIFTISQMTPGSASFSWRCGTRKQFRRTGAASIGAALLSSPLRFSRCAARSASSSCFSAPVF